MSRIILDNTQSENKLQSENKPQLRIIPEGREAIHYAIKHGRKGELVVTLADLVPKDIAYVQEYRDIFLQSKAES